MELRKLQALSGILAPAFFFAAVVYMSLSRPRYSHVYNVISELGETGSPTASAASITFIVTGLDRFLWDRVTLGAKPRT